MSSNLIVFEIAATGAVSIAFAGVKYGIKDGVLKHCKLSKQDSLKNIKIDVLPPILESPSKKTFRIFARKEIVPYLEEFKRIFNSLGMDTSIFNSAYDTVKVRIDMRGLFKNGDYLIDENAIVVNPNDIKRTLFQGLVKMASTRKVGSLYASGFRRYKQERDKILKYSDVGKGISEIYGEIILNRYFYPFMTEMKAGKWAPVLSIEEIIGRDFMEHMFFTCSLDKLVDALNVYASRECVISLIRKIDHFDEALKTPNSVLKNLAVPTYRSIIEDTSSLIIERAAVTNEPCAHELLELQNAEVSSGRTTYKLRPKDKKRIMDQVKTDL